MTSTLYSPHAFGIAAAIPSPATGRLGRIFSFAMSALRLDEHSSDRQTLQRKFTWIVDTHGEMVRRICFGYSRTSAELDDLYQDSLVNLWQGLPRFRGDASLKTWIYRVTLNTCVSSLRTRHKELQCAPADEIYDQIDDTNDNLASIRELHEAIAQLPPLDKAIVIQWLDEFSYEEIAETTGISRANVATRLHRAKEKLKIHMTDR